MASDRSGENIRRLRLSNNMTQDTLGHKLGIDRKHVSKLENGTVSPGKPLVNKLCDVFGVEEMELRFGKRNGVGELLGDSVWDQMASAAWHKLPEAAKKKLLPIILAEVPEGQEAPTVQPHAPVQNGNGER